MRRFKLMNSTGAEWDLMSKQSYFNSPSGLGYGKTFKSAQAGTAWLVSDEQMSQYSISGELVFFDYSKYQEFVEFTSKAPLTLMYAPEQTWYRIRCRIQTLNKGEFKSGYLSVSVVFLAFGFWHEAVTVKQTAKTVSGGKIYPFAYSYTYAETQAGGVVVQNGGLESPCKIHIFGSVTNPAWVLTQGGERISTGKVNATIGAGNKLVVDADPDTMEIAEYTQGGEFVRSLYQYSDFTTARFLYAPAGDSLVTFSHSGTSDITAYVEVEKLAYSV